MTHPTERKKPMSRVFLTMAMSLDGFITGPHDDADNPAGIDGMRLMDWLSTGDDGAVDDGGGGGGQALAARKLRPARWSSTTCWPPAPSSPASAPVSSPGTGEVTITTASTSSCPPTQPPADNPYERVHFVTAGIAECVRQAKEAAAGGRDVMMHGAVAGQGALKAGVLDSIELQLRPFLLGQGRPLFDGLPAEHVDLELVRTLQATGTLHLRYEVRR